jgi:hypothetical protein
MEFKRKQDNVLAWKALIRIRGTEGEVLVRQLGEMDDSRYINDLGFLLA